MILSAVLLDAIRAQIKHEQALARHERRRSDRALNIETKRLRVSRSVRHAERAKLLQSELNQLEQS